MRIKSYLYSKYYDLNYSLFTKNKVIPHFQKTKELTKRIVISNQIGNYDENSNNQVVLEITSIKEVNEFKKIFRISMPDEILSCLCIGTYLFDFYDEQNKLIETIQFHHGTSVRFEKYLGDANIVENEKFLSLLAKLGLEKPLISYNNNISEGEKNQKEYNHWLLNSPKCFKKYEESIINGNEHLIYKKVAKQLIIDVPDVNNRIIYLIKSYGTTDIFWSGYPSYQSLPFKILETYSIKQIIKSYETTNKNITLKKGLGRYICMSDISEIPCSILMELKEMFIEIQNKEGIQRLNKINDC